MRSLIRIGMPLACVALAVTPAAAFGTIASAEPETRWFATMPPKISDDLEISLTRYRFFVDCIAKSEWDVAGKLFDEPINSAEEHRIMRRLRGGDDGSQCSFVLRLRMTPFMLRGGIGEARYRIKTRDSNVTSVNTALVPVPSGASFEWVDYGKSSAASRLSVFSRCLAAREEPSVAAVFRTRMGSNSERGAMQALSRRFGPCLVRGEALKAYSVTFRAWLGEAQYQNYRKTVPDA